MLVLEVWIKNQIQICLKISTYLCIIHLGITFNQLKIFIFCKIENTFNTSVWPLEYIFEDEKYSHYMFSKRYLCWWRLFVEFWWFQEKQFNCISPMYVLWYNVGCEAEEQWVNWLLTFIQAQGVSGGVWHTLRL